MSSPQTPPQRPIKTNSRVRSTLPTASGSSEKAKDGPTVDPKWHHGNFTIISSDGVTFRVKDHILYWASEVFLAAESSVTGQGDKRIELDDREIESAAIVRLFLRTATTLKCDPPDLDSNAPTGIIAKSHLLLFLRKWACNSLFKHVLPSVEPWYEYYPMHCFEVASRLDRPDLCREIIRSAELWKASADDPWLADPKRRGDKFHSAFNPSNWTPRFWAHNKIPAHYLLVLVQAFHVTTVKVDLPRTFERIYKDKYVTQRKDRV